MLFCPNLSYFTAVEFLFLYIIETKKIVEATFPKYNQQDATLLNLFISVKRSTCFRRFFCSSSEAQNCTYSVRHLSDHYWC